MKTYPPTPPSRLDTWLLNLDGDHFAALVCAFIVAVFLACMVVNILVRLGKTEPSVTTRPTSSSRKSGRVRHG